MLIKSWCLFICLMLLVAFVSACQAGSSSYLGQTPPGNTPVIFAQDVVSRGNTHSRLAVSPDGREMFWSTVTFSPLTSTIISVTYRNGEWSTPETPSFALEGMTGNPLFAPDGKKLFYNFTTDIKKGWEIRYVEKTDSGWSEPKNDGFLVNTSSSFTRSGMVYYSDTMADKLWNSGIYSADYSNTGYTNILALDAAINSPYIDYTPYVAPKGDYLLFSSSRPLHDEDMFLYISVLNKDGTWSVPQKMNEKLNYSENARYPSISPDGKYLFFCGDDGNIYWVSSEVIDQFME